MKPTVLVVDDNRSAADALAMVLNRHGYTVSACYDGLAAKARLDAGGVDVVLTDMKMEPVDGLEVLAHARALPAPPEVVVLTGYGTVDAAVKAMHLGARDFMTKPVSPSQVLEQLEQLQGRGQVFAVQGGDSSAAKVLQEQVDAVSRVSSTVLFMGEPGSGRHELARQVHEVAGGGGPFHIVSHPSRWGNHIVDGTVFLPNVDLLSAEDHLALTQLIDSLPPDGPRVLASATPNWGERASSEGAGLQIYYRLAVLVVSVPPLRERPDDLPALLDGWLAARAATLGRPKPSPTARQLKALRLHSWPGNLRELAAVAERAVVFGSSSFDVQIQTSAAAADGIPDLVEGFSLQQHLEEVERTLLIRSIDQTNGDRSQMSKLLGVERNTLRYKLNKYGLLDRA
jgi:DNA-binding NtrC family response regulator